MTQRRDASGLAWLAGLLEGEGSFTLARRGCRGPYPSVRLAMTDEDVVRHAAQVAGVGRIYGPYPPRSNGIKPYWSWHVQTQSDAAGLMMTMYPLMGARRQAAIRTTLAEWRQGACA